MVGGEGGKLRPHLPQGTQGAPPKRDHTQAWTQWAGAAMPLGGAGCRGQRWPPLSQLQECFRVKQLSAEGEELSSCHSCVG